MKLTDDQHFTVEAAQGMPLEVVDPQTQRAYVLLPVELYQQLQSVAADTYDEPRVDEQAEALALKVPLPPPGQPLRLKIRTLSTPPEVAEAMKHYSWWLRFLRPRLVKESEDFLKLYHYFGGLQVSYLPTQEGLIVVAAGRRDSDAYDYLVSHLTPEERRHTVRMFLPRRSGVANELLASLAHES